MSEKKTVMETKGIAGTEQKVKTNIEKKYAESVYLV